MSDTAPRPPSEHASQRSGHRTERSRPLSTAFRYAKRGLASGAFAGVAGLVTFARVRRALRNGSTDDAVRQATMAVFWTGVAMTQWRSRSSASDTGSNDVDQTDVVDTSPDIEDVASGGSQSGLADEDAGTSIPVEESGAGGEGTDVDRSGSDRGEGVDQTDVVDTEPDVEDVDEE